MLCFCTGVTANVLDGAEWLMNVYEIALRFARLALPTGKLTYKVAVLRWRPKRLTLHLTHAMLPSPLPHRTIDHAHLADPRLADLPTPGKSPA